MKLDDYDLYLNPEKCDFELPHIDFLGVQVIEGMVQMEQGKVDKVQEWKPPHNVTEVQRFLGFTGYYQYTDTSAYGMGAILSQEGESTNSKPKCHPVAYYSTTFTPTEQRYNIYKQEFLAVIRALENWWAYLI